MTIDKLIKQAEAQKGVNAELLNATADLLERDGERFDQSACVIEPDDECGTVCCTAGYVLLAAGITARQGQTEKIKDYGRCTLAGALLGISSPMYLFGGDAGEWPAKYRKQLRKAETRPERAKIAATLLRDLAAGKVTL